MCINHRNMTSSAWRSFRILITYVSSITLHHISLPPFHISSFSFPYSTCVLVLKFINHRYAYGLLWEVVFLCTESFLASVIYKIAYGKSSCVPLVLRLAMCTYLFVWELVDQQDSAGRSNGPILFCPLSI